MFADYLLSRRRWSGPRAGFNPAGWISWIVGFAAGAFSLVVSLMLKWDTVKYAFVPRWDWVADKFPHLADKVDPVTGFYHYIPVPQGAPWYLALPWCVLMSPPVTAFVIGFALYVLLSVLGARTRKLPMPGVTA
jgi:purine-cytosine permease-like protein